MEHQQSAKPWEIPALINLANEANVPTFLEHGSVHVRRVMVEVVVKQVIKRRIELINTCKSHVVEVKMWHL